MKSIRIIAVAALCTLTLSCKKEEKTPSKKIGADAAQSSSVAQAIAEPEQEQAQDSEMLTEAKSKPLTTVAFSETNHNFGNIKQGEKVEHIYEVTNTGTNPLIISSVKPGCGCTVPDYTKEPILPGKKGKITLHFDSTNFDGAVNKVADVFVNVEKAPVRLTFSANITK
ncbi:MAG: DUF1573 domain-containing protein [Weeksellaceae bacterium]|nr:DUF1573 domain-containing protein [Weeksellaceae bacterium]